MHKIESNISKQEKKKHKTLWKIVVPSPGFEPGPSVSYSSPLEYITLPL